MKITRKGFDCVLNPVEIELTEAELEQAYRERRRYYNIEDIKCKLEEILTEYEDYPDEYTTNISGIYASVTVGDIRAKLNDDEWLKVTAEQFDKALENNDGFMESFWLTAEYVIKDRLEE